MQRLPNTLAILAVTLVTSGVALAQDAEPPSVAGSKTIGADVAFVLPLGDYANGTDFAAGALGRLEYNVSDVLAVTARAGYLYNKMSASGVDVGMIPVLAGASYKLGTALSVYGELGVTNIRVSVDGFGSDSSTKLSVGAGAGYQAGKLKARVGVFMPGSFDNGSAGGSTTLYGVLATVGYDFVSL